VKESETRKQVKKVFNKFYDLDMFWIINQHGGRYSIVGIPDVIVLTEDKRYWFEIKRDWQDEPTVIQKFWVEELRRFGFVTGFVIGTKYKYAWNDDTTIDLKDLIKSKMGEFS